MDFSVLSEEQKESLKERYTQQELELIYDYFDCVENNNNLELWLNTNVDSYKILGFEYCENDIIKLMIKNRYESANTIDMKLNDFYEIFEKRSLF